MRKLCGEPFLERINKVDITLPTCLLRSARCCFKDGTRAWIPQGQFRIRVESGTVSSRGNDHLCSRAAYFRAALDFNRVLHSRHNLISPDAMGMGERLNLY